MNYETSSHRTFSGETSVLTQMIRSMDTLRIAQLMTDVPPDQAARFLSGKLEPDQAARVLLRIGDSDKDLARDLFGRMDPASAARIIPEITALAGIQPVADTLSGMRSTRAAQILTELTGTRPRLAASVLHTMDEKAAVGVGKTLRAETLSRMLDPLNPQDRAEIMDHLKGTRITRLLVQDDSKAGDTLLHMKNKEAAVDAVKKLPKEMQAQVLGEVGSRAAALALNDMRGRQVAHVLEEIAKTSSDQAARRLEAMQPDKRVGAVKAMDQQVASNLMEQMRSKIAADIAERLASRQATRLLKGFKSPEKADAVVAHIGKEDVARRLNENLVKARTEASLTPAALTARLLETEPQAERTMIASQLSSAKLAEALDKIELAPLAADILLSIDPHDAAQAFGRMQPERAANLVPELGPHAAALALERLDPTRVTRIFEKLTETSPELAARTLRAMNGDARVWTIEALKPETAAILWEQMATTVAIQIAQTMRADRALDMIELTRPERVAEIAQYITHQMSLDLLTTMDRLEMRSVTNRRLKAVGSLIVTAPIATSIGMFPTVVLYGVHWAALGSAVAGGTAADAIAFNILPRHIDKIRNPDWVPRIGGKPLGDNQKQFAFSGVWSGSATGSELAQNALVPPIVHFIKRMFSHH